MSESPTSVSKPSSTTEINWEARCTKLESQISVLKQVSVLRKSLLELRENEAKSLISKFQILEEVVSEEKKCRSELVRRLASSELESEDLRDKLRRNAETMERLRSAHEEQKGTLLSNLESVEFKCKQQTNELENLHLENSQLQRKVDEFTLKLKETEKAIKSLEGKLKKTTDRSQFLSCQVSLINELLHEKVDVPIDMPKIKAILRQSEDISNTDSVPDQTEEDEGVELSCLFDNLDSSENAEPEDIPGEESCYKSVDTKDGPQMILSVSRTFIKLKDLILEKKSLQTEINSLKNFNTKLESKLDRQEHRLYCVTKEVNRTWTLVSKLKLQQDRLHNSEAVLKYELKEKRLLLERLRKELLSYRDKWRKVREKTSESQFIWQQLRDEFTQRREQSLSESLSADDTLTEEASESAQKQRRPSSL